MTRPHSLDARSRKPHFEPFLGQAAENMQKEKAALLVKKQELETKIWQATGEMMRLVHGADTLLRALQEVCCQDLSPPLSPVSFPSEPFDRPNEFIGIRRTARNWFLRAIDDSKSAHNLGRSSTSGEVNNSSQRNRTGFFESSEAGASPNSEKRGRNRENRDRRDRRYSQAAPNKDKWIKLEVTYLNLQKTRREILWAWNYFYENGIRVRGMRGLRNWKNSAVHLLQNLRSFFPDSRSVRKTLRHSKRENTGAGSSRDSPASDDIDIETDSDLDVFKPGTRRRASQN